MILTTNNLRKQQTIPNMENKQTKGLKRNTIDKYYTKNVVIDFCLNHFKKNIEIKPDDLVIEPSAGKLIQKN